jgi:hypothetical protein
MKNIRKAITILCLATMASTVPTQTEATTYVSDTGGCAYEDAYQACCVAPAVVFGVALLTAIIVVGLHNRHGHSHH